MTGPLARARALGGASTAAFLLLFIAALGDVAIRIAPSGALSLVGAASDLAGPLLRACDGGVVLALAGLFWASAPSGAGRFAWRAAAAVVAGGELLGLGLLVTGSIGRLDPDLADAGLIIVGGAYLAAPALLAAGALAARFPYGDLRPRVLACSVFGVLACGLVLGSAVVASGSAAVHLADGIAALAVGAWGLLGAVLLADGRPWPARGRVVLVAAIVLLLVVYGLDALLRLAPGTGSAPIGLAIEGGVVLAHVGLALGAARAIASPA